MDLPHITNRESSPDFLFFSKFWVRGGYKYNHGTQILKLMKASREITPRVTDCKIHMTDFSPEEMRAITILHNDTITRMLLFKANDNPFWRKLRTNKTTVKHAIKWLPPEQGHLYSCMIIRTFYL